jgi:hypothetical protein
MAIKYSNIFHFKALQNFPQTGIFGLKIYHLATLLAERVVGMIRTSCAEPFKKVSERSKLLVWVSDGTGVTAANEIREQCQRT